jgi:LemA protein
MDTSWIILIVVALLLLSWLVSVFNQCITMIEAIKNDQRQIDIQLDRRFKVFESLINVVKKYMDYEKTTLKDVVALRNQAKQAQDTGDFKGRVLAEQGLTKIASGIQVAFEAYPDLKANQNVLQLQEEIVNTENKLAFSKQSYNDGIERYNAFKKMFFQSFVVSMLRSKLDQEFAYWRISAAKAKEHEEFTVKL